MEVTCCQNEADDETCLTSFSTKENTKCLFLNVDGPTVLFIGSHFFILSYFTKAEKQRFEKLCQK